MEAKTDALVIELLPTGELLKGTMVREKRMRAPSEEEIAAREAKSKALTLDEIREAAERSQAVSEWLAAKHPGMRICEAQDAGIFFPMILGSGDRGGGGWLTIDPQHPDAMKLWEAAYLRFAALTAPDRSALSPVQKLRRISALNVDGSVIEWIPLRNKGERVCKWQPFHMEPDGITARREVGWCPMGGGLDDIEEAPPDVTKETLEAMQLAEDKRLQRDARQAREQRKIEERGTPRETVTGVTLEKAPEHITRDPRTIASMKLTRG